MSKKIYIEELAEKVQLSDADKVKLVGGTKKSDQIDILGGKSDVGVNDGSGDKEPCGISSTSHPSEI